jgi:hypothetical protein
MSWETINKILGLAALDQDFLQELLKYPVAAVQARGFELTPEEQEVFSKIVASDLSEFSQYVLDHLAPGRQEPDRQNNSSWQTLAWEQSRGADWIHLYLKYRYSRVYLRHSR